MSKKEKNMMPRPTTESDIQKIIDESIKSDFAKNEAKKSDKASNVMKDNDSPPISPSDDIIQKILNEGLHKEAQDENRNMLGSEPEFTLDSKSEAIIRTAVDSVIASALKNYPDTLIAQLLSSPHKLTVADITRNQNAELYAAFLALTKTGLEYVVNLDAQKDEAYKEVNRELLTLLTKVVDHTLTMNSLLTNIATYRLELENGINNINKMINKLYEQIMKQKEEEKKSS